MQYERRNHKPSSVLRTILAFTILLVISLMILSFPVGAYSFFGTNIGSTGGERIVGYIPLIIFGQPFFIQMPITYSQLFIVLWIIYVVLFATTFFGPNSSVLGILGQLNERGLGVLFQNGITLLASTFPILISSMSLVSFLQEQAGIPTGSLPPEDPAMEFTYLTLAPLVEELGFRVSIIGLVAILLNTQAGLSGIFRTLVFPVRSMDSKKKNSRFAGIIFAIFLSAVLFGYAHIAYGTGWEIGKFSLATLAGLVLGWTYVKSGLPAAILLHWSFNYFTGSYYYFDMALNASMLSSFVDGVILFSGAIMAIALGISLVRRIHVSRLSRES